MSSYPYSLLKQKFAHLNSNRRHQQALYLWRSIVAGLFSSSLLIALVLYPRKITKPSQVVINSDRSINTAKIYQHLDIPLAQSQQSQSQLPGYLYLKSPWIISSQSIISRLESISAIETARITKTIFPPRIKIHLQEKIPVVTAISSGKVGFLDRQGNWLEPSLYNHRAENLPLTKIKVVNFTEKNKSTYVKLLKLLSAYPQVGLKEMSWSEEGYLSLITKDLKVRFGANPQLIQQQFDYLVNFPSKSKEKVVKNSSWLDLTNPESPFLE